MKNNTPHLRFPALAALLLPLMVQAEPAATGGNVRVHFDASGSGGGQVSGGNFSAEISVGDGVAGGVSDVTAGGAQAKGGYTGQLYDTKSLVVTADPGPSVNEGDAVQLSAAVTMDDQSILNTTDADWSVLSGPIVSIDDGGLAVAGAVTSNQAAVVQGVFDGIADGLDLTVINLPFEAKPLIWDDPAPGENGPYKVLMGPSAGSLTEIANPAGKFFNPGQLDMGTTYFWQILDASDTDITPGGTGPASFTTNLYQSDMRIGTKGLPSAHKGNNVYNLTGAGQLAKIKMTGTKKGKVYFSVENDGDIIDSHTVRGTRASKKFKFIKYFRVTGGRANITSAAIKAGYVQADVDPGDIVSYEIQAKANGKKRAAQTLKIGATSASDSRAGDLAKSKLKGLVKKK